MQKIEGHTFKPELLSPGSLVIDIGGNTGGFAQSMLNLFKCRVVCYEPDRTAFNYLNSIQSDRFSVFQMAVSGKAGKSSFYSAQPMNGGNSILQGNREWGRYPGQDSIYEVEVAAFDSIVQAFDQIDLMKMDCEGSELSIIRESNPENFKKIKQLCIEFHDFAYKGITTKDTDECIEILKGTGFNAVYDHNDPDRDYYFYR